MTAPEPRDGDSAALLAVLDALLQSSPQRAAKSPYKVKDERHSLESDSGVRRVVTGN